MKQIKLKLPRICKNKTKQNKKNIRRPGASHKSLSNICYKEPEMSIHQRRLAKVMCEILHI